MLYRGGLLFFFFFFFSSRRRHTRWTGDWSSDVCSSDLVNTASGDQEIGSVTSGKVTLKSASGNLKVGIREGSTLWVDARSRSGEVVSELPVSELPPDGSGPTVELRANTMSGDITVSRA